MSDIYNFTTEYNKRSAEWLQGYYNQIRQKEDEYYDNGFTRVTFYNNMDRFTCPEGEWTIMYNGSGNIDVITYINVRYRSFVVYELE